MTRPGGGESFYVVLEDYTVEFKFNGVLRQFTVPKGMLTDLCSIPRIFRIMFGRVGPWLEAAIVHDALFCLWQLFDGREPTEHDWLFANAVMDAGLKSAGVGRVTRWLFRQALSTRWSRDTFDGRNDGEDGMGLFVVVPNKTGETRP